MSQHKKSKSCIGWKQYEEICENKTYKEPYLWCDRCEKLRRKYLDKQFKNITKLFDNA